SLATVRLSWLISRLSALRSRRSAAMSRLSWLISRRSLRTSRLSLRISRRSRWASVGVVVVVLVPLVVCALTSVASDKPAITRQLLNVDVIFFTLILLFFFPTKQRVNPLLLENTGANEKFCRARVATKIHSSNFLYSAVLRE